MADDPAFQKHHIIEQQVLKKSPLIGKLQEFGLFDIDDPRNKLNMPVKRELAAEMGVSPHNGGPLKTYSDGLGEQLDKLERSLDGQAALQGDKAAAGRITDRVSSLRDTMRAGLINGDLFTNTPKETAVEIPNAKNAEFFGDLEGYNQKHADQIGKFSKVAANEWDLSITSEARITATLEAIEKDGAKAARGSPEDARNTLGAAIAQAREAGTLSISDTFVATLRDKFMIGLRGAAAAGVMADIAVSTLEAKELAEKGDAVGAHSVMSGLGARMAFGWLGAEWGASIGRGAGLYGVLGGAALGGLAGVIGGEALVKAIQDAANWFTGAVGLEKNVTSITPAKAPEARIGADGSTTITEFNRNNDKSSNITTYDNQGRLTRSDTIHADGSIQGKTYQPDSALGISKPRWDNTYDAKGRLIKAVNNHDDGVRFEGTYEPDSALGASKPRWENTYDASGRLKRASTYYDDGTHWQGDYEPDSALGTSKPRWEHKYDAKGRVLSASANNFDGTRWDGVYEPDGALGTSKPRWENSYDAKGRLRTASTNFDDGSLLDTIYEPDGVFGRSKPRWENTYDATRRQTKAATNNVDGSRVEHILDPATRNVIHENRFNIANAVTTAHQVAEIRQKVINDIAWAASKRQGDKRTFIDVEKKNRVAEYLGTIEIGPITIEKDPNATEYEEKLRVFFNQKLKEVGIAATAGRVSVDRSGGDTAAGRGNGDTAGNHRGRGGNTSGKGNGISVGLGRTGQWSGPNNPFSAPIALDLNNDDMIAMNTLDINKIDNNGPRFDWDGDGFPDQTAWVGPKDGLLVIDLAKDGTAGPDGKIDQPKEIAFALWKSEDERQAELKAKGIDDTGQPVTDLEGLRHAFDTNRDNVLDMRDERWSEFRVWQDNNQNGTVETGELRTMEQAGIRLIDLIPSKEGAKAFADGSAITGTSKALMTDGTKMLVGDVSLAYRPSLTAR